MNEFYRHKKSDKIKWVFTGVAFLLVFAMLIGMCLQLFGTGKQKPSEWFKKSETEQITAVSDFNGENKTVDGVVVNAKVSQGIRLMSAKLFTAGTYSAEGVSQTVTATIYPVSAVNKAVDWALVWSDTGEPVTDCVSLIIPSDGALTVTLTCTKAFPDRSMKLICTSRDSGVRAELSVTCEGKPSDITINNGSAVSVNWSKSATYNISLDNAFGYVGEKFYNDLTVKSVTLYGTIKHYDVAYVNRFESGGTAVYNNELSDYDGVITYDFAEKYPNALSASISGHSLNLSAISLPSATYGSCSTGAPAIHGGGNGTRYSDVTLAPENVYADVVVGTGSLTKTVRVNFIAGVTSISMSNAVVF